MKPFPLPVHGVGPGSQAGDEALDCLSMPSDMAVFRQPPSPEAADPQALIEVRAFLARHPEFRPEPVQPPFPVLARGLGVYVDPRGGLDGFYYAKLRKVNSQA